jgi:hypothetical protein
MYFEGEILEDYIKEIHASSRAIGGSIKGERILELYTIPSIK